MTRMHGIIGLRYLRKIIVDLDQLAPENSYIELLGDNFFPFCPFCCKIV
jgi:hypothetical protein